MCPRSREHRVERSEGQPGTLRMTSQSRQLRNGGLNDLVGQEVGDGRSRQRPTGERPSVGWGPGH